ncbi:Uncharacterized protein AArcCO_0460 [Halalkaliarchaeum sp. AArc-CO]|uniref:hypothetical protein n=1 Tax=unclassified Halalkaliarchaeum TaxID=2678344 RepID=UPI00217ED207|nr:MULTISPECIES: hypothetical protein [unclassified Halalkaliarchaeum]MDR5673529.1 hypothetical protein [Halalkaliarchaeum sp. AArc-GB]UWG49784.1 Uncharacterized protein AArcCO_0460 [Halalkaliarchaeum sp. AArc-CO]
MPEIRITEPQELRFDSLREELEEAHVDQYGTVRDCDVVSYLLDLADAVEDPDRAAAAGTQIDGDEAEIEQPEDAEESDTETDAEATDDGVEEDDGDNNDGDDESRLNAMMSLLDTHEDKWREGDGEARYEVDLPDGETATAQTKDDVRALLFKNY